MKTNDFPPGLEHLAGLKPALRKALQPLLEPPPLTFDYHSSDRTEGGTLQVMFEASDRRTYV